MAIGLGKHTYLTIKQNLFWAFAYNVLAIPIAAAGYLTPTWGAGIMALSDVVLIANSLRLKYKKNGLGISIKPILLGGIVTRFFQGTAKVFSVTGLGFVFSLLSVFT